MQGKDEKGNYAQYHNLSKSTVWSLYRKLLKFFFSYKKVYFGDNDFCQKNISRNLPIKF